MRTLSTEQWADVATLGMITIMWAVMLFFEIRRTWQWDALGRALTVLTAGLLVSYALAVVSILTTWDLWVPVLRWSIRAFLLSAGTAVIIVLVRDRPPAKDGAR